MARDDTMMQPKVEDLLGQVDSKFSLVTLAARRARQINSYFNQLGEGLGAIVPPQVASQARKPLSMAFEEIAAEKITFVRPSDHEGDELGEQEPGEATDAGEHGLPDGLDPASTSTDASTDGA